MALKQSDRLESNNPKAFGIAKATEISGHRTISNLNNLYLIPDCILSETKRNLGGDAIGQTWYVVKEGAEYRLVDWEKRRTQEGWKKADGDYIAGEGIKIEGGVISCTLDTNLFKVVMFLPEASADTTNKIYLLLSAEGGDENIYTEYITVESSGVWVWEKLGEYQISLDGYLTKEEASTTYATQDLATTSSKGLMSEEDKVRLDSIYAGNMALVTPVLNGVWTYKNQSGENIPGLSNSGLEYGYSAKWTGTWSWTAVEGKKSPTVVSGAWSKLIPAGTKSEEYTTGDITTNRTVTVTLGAPKTGLMVSGSSVVPAAGNDTTSASSSVVFKHRLYYGKTTDPLVTDLSGLSSELVSGRGKTITGISCELNEYYVYAYPSSLGNLSGIIQDGATPVLGAFTKLSKTIVNQAGLEITLLVYISNNPGAFTGAKLQFS